MGSWIKVLDYWGSCARINRGQPLYPMAQETIKFTIKQDGTVTEEVIGVQGKNCEDLTRVIENKLGVIERVEHKAEYYDQNVTTQENVSLHMHQDSD